MADQMRASPSRGCTHALRDPSSRRIAVRAGPSRTSAGTSAGHDCAPRGRRVSQLKEWQHVDVAVPQAHLPGAEAEVDFGECHAVIAGAVESSRVANASRRTRRAFRRSA
jgi:hypothetical protein